MRNEATELVRANALRFLHFSRPEVCFPEDVARYDARVYTRARENLKRLVKMECWCKTRHRRSTSIA